ncbi:glycosyltransferase family 9 protein [Roseomonas sp. WA12]
MSANDVGSVAPPLADLPDWIADPAHPVRPDVAAAAIRTAPDRAGAIALIEGGRKRGVILWRRDYLRQLAEYNLADPKDPAGILARAAEFPNLHHYLHAPHGPPVARIGEAEAHGGTVLLISAFGFEKFGGAERFLEQMAGLYRDLGYEPVVVGLLSRRAGEVATIDGLRYVFLQPTPAALFRFAVAERARIAHVVSGLGHEVAATLRYLQTRIIFGVHFWREIFEPPTSHPGYYPDCPEGYATRRNMPLLLTDADAVYANSAFTREILETRFGARVGVIPSLPDDRASPLPSSTGREVALLANSRFDKGFDMLLRVAPKVPEVHFVALASQSGREVAQALLDASGVVNVTILGRQDEMDALYATARVVLAPSYRFVETFSRVVLEAQRHGIPVIGSDRGNIPLLLHESGVSLPEDEDLWAEEVRRLFTDPGYWDARSAASLENAARHPFANQPARLSGLLSGLFTPVLVGVGSGLGNIIHTTPMLRRLSEHLGQRIDVVVAGDSRSATAIPADPRYIRHVFALNDVPVRRAYDTVFLTNSFGALQPPFRASRVVHSRDWDSFHAGHHLHETEFNLAALRELLGVPYAPEDVARYFIAGIKQRPGSAGLVGFHAGSKSGKWAAKRWPYFAELAGRLQLAGLKVASFGSEDEHVEGTINRTGGSIEQMARAMQDCGAFVSNDSGLMNVANALDIPLVALFGPTEVRTRGPLGPRSICLALSGDCAPCELLGTAGPFYRQACSCIAAIPVSEVESAVLERVSDVASVRAERQRWIALPKLGPTISNG